MSFLSPPKKNKIELSDYNYKKDIESRVFLSNLTLFEADILKEIIYNSLKFDIAEITSIFAISESEIHPFLLRLKEIKLLDLNDKTIIVDKDLRKYYEIQIERLSETFEPNLDYVQSLLNQLPLNVLPNWYQIPKTANGFFEAIQEKTFASPKIYQKYLQELQLEEPLLNDIIQEVFKTPGYTVKASLLREKFKLTKEQFAEALLKLEFHFAAFLIYKPVKDRWEEFVSPFSEWKSYLEFIDRTECSSISNPQKIEKIFDNEFGFLGCVVQCLTKAFDTSSICSAKASTLFPPLLNFSKVIEKLSSMNLLKKTPSELLLTKHGVDFLKQNSPSQSMALYLHAIGSLRTKQNDSRFTDRDAREVEKSLKNILHLDWVYFDDFFAGLRGPIGVKETAVSPKKGKKSAFQIPQYSTEEKLFVQEWIFEHLFSAGMVLVGSLEGRLCFKVTSFGKLSLGDE